MLPASSGLRPGMLPNTLQCTGRPPQQRGMWPQMSIVPRWRGPDLQAAVTVFTEEAKIAGVGGSSGMCWLEGGGSYRGKWIMVNSCFHPPPHCHFLFPALPSWGARHISQSLSRQPMPPDLCLHVPLFLSLWQFLNWFSGSYSNARHLLCDTFCDPLLLAPCLLDRENSLPLLPPTEALITCIVRVSLPFREK